MSNFAEERLAICNSCVYNEDNSCILCSCELIEKTNNPNESCPLMPARWGKADLSIVETKKGAESTGQITAKPTPPPRTVCIPCNQR